MSALLLPTGCLIIVFVVCKACLEDSVLDLMDDGDEKVMEKAESLEFEEDPGIEATEPDMNKSGGQTELQ